MTIAFIILLIMLLNLNYYDAFTTVRIVKNGSPRNERNPIARWLIKRFGTIRGIIIIKSLIVLLIPIIFYAFILSKRDTVYTLILANLIYIAVAVNNTKVAKKMGVSLKMRNGD